MKSPNKGMIASQTIGDAETDIVAKLVADLASGVAGKVGDAAAGWILKAVGIDTGGDQAEVKRIEDTLAAQAKMLKAIQHEISALEQEIRTAVNEIEDAIARSEYNTAIRILDSDVAMIQGLQERLKVQSVLSPKPANQADAMLLRNDILSQIPRALAAINDSMMGTAGAEGVYSLWSRLSFKHSTSLSDYASKVYQQFMYYYSMQVNALQLMLEAYHCAEQPEIAAANQYYIDWRTTMVAQIDEYQKNAARTSIEQVLSVNGAVLDIAATDDHVYIATVGWVHSFKTADWSADGSLNTGLPRHAQLRLAGDNLLVVGPLSTDVDDAYKVLKVGTTGGLTLQGQTTVHSVHSEPVLIVCGLAVDVDNLYLLTMEWGTEGYKIQVVDIESMTLQTAKQFTYSEGIEGIGELAVVGTTALMPGYYDGGGDMLTTVDLTTRQILAKLPLPITASGGNGDVGGSPISVSDGVAIFAQMDVNVWIADVSNSNNPKLLQTANFGTYLHSMEMESARNLTYFSAGEQYSNPKGLYSVYRTQYQEALSMPWDIGSNIAALRVAGDYLYVGSPPSVARGKVTVIGFTYPITTPPDPSGGSRRGAIPDGRS